MAANALVSPGMQDQYLKPKVPKSLTVEQQQRVDENVAAFRKKREEEHRILQAKAEERNDDDTVVIKEINYSIKTCQYPGPYPARSWQARQDCIKLGKPSFVGSFGLSTQEDVPFCVFVEILADKFDGIPSSLVAQLPQEHVAVPLDKLQWEKTDKCWYNRPMWTDTEKHVWWRVTLPCIAEDEEHYIPITHVLRSFGYVRVGGGYGYSDDESDILCDCEEDCTESER